ncbi:MAG: molybdenum cofactor guanylyltransferase [Thermodesulfovibrionia bacterium]
MVFISDSTGVILAGGENRRMPVLKGFIRVHGKPIIERNLNLMKGLFQEVFIITNQPEFYIHLDARLFGDVYDIRGPMTGILTALMNAKNKWVFITACDMPFIDEGVIRYLSSKRDDYDAVLFKSEPLLAFYSKSLLNPMEEALISGKNGINDFLKDKRVKYIKSCEIKGWERSFINLNTPWDVEKVGANLCVHPKTERGKEG